MADLTPEELARGEALLADMIPAPWVVAKWCDHCIDGPKGCTVAGNYDYEEGGIIRDEDAKAIVWLRNNAAALIAAARELECGKELMRMATSALIDEGRELAEMRRQRDAALAEVERLRSCVTSAEQAAEQAAQAAKLDRVALRVLLRDLAEAEDLHEFLRIKANAATVHVPAAMGDPLVLELAAEVKGLRDQRDALLAAAELVADALRDIAGDGHAVYLEAYEFVVDRIKEAANG